MCSFCGKNSFRRPTIHQRCSYEDASHLIKLKQCTVINTLLIHKAIMTDGSGEVLIRNVSKFRKIMLLTHPKWQLNENINQTKQTRETAPSYYSCNCHRVANAHGLTLQFTRNFHFLQRLAPNSFSFHQICKRKYTTASFPGESRHLQWAPALNSLQTDVVNVVEAFPRFTQ